MAAFFVTFFIIFYNVLEMSAPYTDKYSKTVLQTAFFYSPVLPKTAGSSFCSQIGYKIRNDDRRDHKLPDTGSLKKRLRLIAYIADDRMDLSTVAGIHRRQFTDQTFYRHTGTRKDISRIPIRYFQPKTKRDFWRFLRAVRYSHGVDKHLLRHHCHEDGKDAGDPARQSRSVLFSSAASFQKSRIIFF